MAETQTETQHRLKGVDSKKDYLVPESTHLTFVFDTDIALIFNPSISGDQQLTKQRGEDGSFGDEGDDTYGDDEWSEGLW